MRVCLRVVVLLAIAVARLAAQPNATPARLAVVVEDPSLAVAGDVLTTELSHRTGLQLFEREEINRVYREQQLSAANRDYLKLGQILGADGLLLLGTLREGTNQFLSARLVATRPGVVISQVRSHWPIPNPAQWAGGMVNHFEPLFPKLTVLVKDAVPVSVVNLRSAVQSREAPELEWQLTLLTIERLSRERQLFVLERRKMQFLGAEHELSGLDDSAFWNGSYLLEGTIDRDGYSPQTVTINARLIPPQGGAPLAIDLTGSRTNLPEVIRQLTARVLESLKLQPSAKAWNPADEANQYFEEAKWASRWRLPEVAQAASESAWALGNRTKSLALLRVRIYTESTLRPESPNSPANLEVPAVPDPAKLKTASRALELFCQNPFRNPTNPAALDLETFDTGLRALRTAARLLEGFYYDADSRRGNERDLAELRAWSRQTVELLSTGEPDARKNPGATMFSWRTWTPYELYNSVQWLNWEEGGIWQEKPEDGLPAFRELVEHGYFPEDLPRIVGWTWADRQRAPAVLRRFTEDLCSSTNPIARLEGHFLALVRTPVDAEGNSAARESELYAEIWDQRRWIFDHPIQLSVLPRSEAVLRDKRLSSSDANRRIEYDPFNRLVHRLRLDYLSNQTNFNYRAFRMLFPDEFYYSQSEAVELQPLLANFKALVPPERTNLSAVVSVANTIKRIADDDFRWVAPKPGPATVPPEQPVEMKFISWTVHPPANGPEVRASLSRPIFRQGKIWCSISYYSTNGYWFYDQSAAFLQIDPINGNCVEIPYPRELYERTYSREFEVSKDSLFVSMGQRFMRYQLRDKVWTELHLPLESAARMAALNDSLYLGTDVNLFELNPDSGSVKVLASSRRRPVVEELDAFWDSSAQIYARSDGQLGVQVTNRLFSFNPATRKWSTVQIPSPPRLYSAYLVFSGNSVQWLSGGDRPYRQLIAFWNDRSQGELLLEQKDRRMRGAAAPDRSYGLPKWNWPEPFRMDFPLYAPDGKKLWVLNPRRPLWHWAAGEEPVAFQDNREATLMSFEPDRRDGRSAPLVFHRDGKLVDAFAHNVPLNRMDTHVPYFFATEQGLIMTGPDWTGHWLLSKTVLESRLKPITLEQPEPSNTQTNIQSTSKP